LFNHSDLPGIHWRQYLQLDTRSYDLCELAHIHVLLCQINFSGCPRITKGALRLGTFFSKAYFSIPKEIRLSFFLLHSVTRRFSKNRPIFYRSSIAQSYWETFIDRSSVVDFLLYIKTKNLTFISFDFGNFYYTRHKFIIKDFYFFKENYPKYYRDFLYKNEKNGFIFFFNFQSTANYKKIRSISLYLKFYGVI
jgi:hypothetical protein